jgi:hypothetical protein
VRTSVAVWIWNGLFFAMLLIPLAIFWQDRGSVFPHDPGVADPSLVRHILASAMYVTMVVLAMAWLRTGGKQAVLLGALTFSAAIGAVTAFEGTVVQAVKATGVRSLGLDLAVAILVYFSAIVAGSTLLSGIVVAVRRARAR